MSAEDETFDIDLYGDDPEEDETISQATNQNLQQQQTTQPESRPDTIAQPCQPQGIKRKASDEELPHSYERDERPLDPNAQISLKLTELQWWTTEEDLRHFCAQARVEEELVEVAFAEHKINGKSKGDAYLEFKTPQAAGLTKRAIEKANAELDAGKANPNKSKIQVWYTAPGNPFKVREGQSKKEGTGAKFSQGAYNNHGSTRGTFTGRGRGGFNRGGSQWSGQNNGNQNFNNGMMNGYGNMGFNGSQGMMNPMAMMMAGSFMGMPNMMGGRGGSNMMGRGGWNMGQGGQQGGYQQNWDNGNKKPRTE